MELPFDLVVSLLRIFPENVKTPIKKNLGTLMLVKNTYKKSVANLVCSGEILKVFSLYKKVRQDVLYYHFYLILFKL